MDEIQISGDGFVVTMRDGSVLNLDVGSASMTVDGSVCNGFAERQALPVKTRCHRTGDRLSATVEQERVVPFGGEVRIRRSVTVADGFALITADIRAGRGESLRQCLLDPMRLRGSWRRFGVSTDGVRFEWRQAGDDEVTLPFAEEPPRCLAEDESGCRIEFGCGNDLWRHRIGGALPQSNASFTVRLTRKEIVCVRKMLDFAKDAEVPHRPWRWEYYIAWHDAAAASRDDAETACTGGALPVDPCACGGRPAQTPAAGRCACLVAPAMRRRLRSLVRSATDSLVLTTPPPCVCTEASHMGRGSRSSLDHWDFGERLAVKLWGCRQLARIGGALYWLPWEGGGDGAADLVLTRRLRPLRNVES